MQSAEDDDGPRKAAIRYNYSEEVHAGSQIMVLVIGAVPTDHVGPGLICRLCGSMHEPPGDIMDSEPYRRRIGEIEVHVDAPRSWIGGRWRHSKNVWCTRGRSHSDRLASIADAVPIGVALIRIRRGWTVVVVVRNAVLVCVGYEALHVSAIDGSTVVHEGQSKGTLSQRPAEAVNDPPSLGASIMGYANYRLYGVGWDNLVHRAETGIPSRMG